MDADNYVNDANDDDDADDDDDDDVYVLVLRWRNPTVQWPWRLHLVSTKHLPFSFSTADSISSRLSSLSVNELSA